MRKMAQNEIEEMLDQLRRIKSGGDLDSFKIDQYEKLEMDLRLLRTFIKYHHVPDYTVILTKTANMMVQMLRWDFVGIPNLNLEKLESPLLEFTKGDTSLSYNSELNGSDLSEYMDRLGENLNDVLKYHREWERSSLEKNQFIKKMEIVQKKMRFWRYLYATEINGYVNHEKLEYLETQLQFIANNVGQFCLAVLVDVAESEDDIFNKPPYLLCLIVLVKLEMKKIFLGELQASKFTQSKIFKDKKLPKGFSHHLHSLLMYLKNKKLENFPNIVAENIDVAIDFLLVFLDADVSNHVNNANWLNEIMEKVAVIASDILYVIQKLLPRSINKDDTSKIDICSMQILEKTKDLKAPVESYYKSLKFTPSQFRAVCGLRFLDSLVSKLNEMLKSKSDLDFMMKLLFDNLERELSSLTSILEEELSSLSSIFRDVAKVHHEHEILKDFQRRTISLAYEAEVSIDSILVQYNVFWHIFCSLPTILKEIKQINAKVTEMWSADVALKYHYVVEPSKHLPSQHSNPVSDDDEIVGFEIATEN
ncbi:putative late blight resistance protein -like protein R1B-14 isoform 2 [Capsicum annuum]|nr:putative late blight resistance protein -like protein R1B-14 isoform 2 [Capsicum annuum]